MHLGKIKKAYETLKISRSILLITHGEKHSVLMENLIPLLSQAIGEIRGINN